jgi:hypothetical protein
MRQTIGDAGGRSKISSTCPVLFSFYRHAMPWSTCNVFTKCVSSNLLEAVRLAKPGRSICSIAPAIWSVGRPWPGAASGVRSPAGLVRRPPWAHAVGPHPADLACLTSEASGRPLPQRGARDRSMAMPDPCLPDRYSSCKASAA